MNKNLEKQIIIIALFLLLFVCGLTPMLFAGIMKIESWNSDEMLASILGLAPIVYAYLFIFKKFQFVYQKSQIIDDTIILRSEFEKNFLGFLKLLLLQFGFFLLEVFTGKNFSDITTNIILAFSFIVFAFLEPFIIYILYKERHAPIQQVRNG